MSLEGWLLVNNMTIESAIRSAAKWLDQYDLVYGHGTASSLDEAAWLVLEAMSESPLEEPDYQKVLTEDNKRKAINFLEKRAIDKIPAAYITGRTWFAGLEFYADERALIPRSPLAEPIMQGFSDYIDPTAVTRVLDLCTGGGCIAIACAYAFAEAQVDASDISEDALSLANKNVALHGMEDRVKLINSDVFSALSPTGQYDVIISNPPYVDAKDMSDLADEFHSEPALGLVAGNDGLDIVRHILENTREFLSPAGILICEVGNSAAALEAAYPELPFRWLEFENGGYGIFMLTAEELLAQ